MTPTRRLVLPIALLALACSAPSPPPESEEPATDEVLPGPVASRVEESLAQEETASARREIDWILVADLERAADDLERIADDARFEVMGIGEVEGEAMPGRARLEAEWNRWSRAWHERLRFERPVLPAVPFDTPASELLYARQALERGWNELELLPITAYSWTNVPALYERERHLDAAVAAAGEARAQLGKLDR